MESVLSRTRPAPSWRPPRQKKPNLPPAGTSVPKQSTFPPPPPFPPPAKKTPGGGKETESSRKANDGLSRDRSRQVHRSALLPRVDRGRSAGSDVGEAAQAARLRVVTFRIEPEHRR